MNVLLVSQCDKRALTETRRILDQFAERRGDRTWQTPITQAGLDTLRRLLRKTARKNTAVACHWIRGLDNSELLWTVGAANRFNADGAVPTNTTKRNVLRAEDENDWQTLETIRLLAGMAALWHDVGKANDIFAAKLTARTRPQKDPYRHEWVSFRLFQAFVGQASAGTDDDWLKRLVEGNFTALDNERALYRDGLELLDGPAPPTLASLPPIARAVGWLVLTHHRLPISPVAHSLGPASLSDLLQAIDADWCGSSGAEVDESPATFLARLRAVWSFSKGLPHLSAEWRKRVEKLAKSLTTHRAAHGTDWLRANPFVAHIARMSLMLADHHYSSLPPDDTRRLKFVTTYDVYANTDKEGRLKQRLDEHLMGVEKAAHRIVQMLPRLEKDLPRLTRAKGFAQRTADPAFAWQNKAFDLAVALAEVSQVQGFFGINMASTGTGKTLGNGRIAYGLADPIRGARFSVALGLRTLTLQTGLAFRERLKLDDDALAVLVGGAAVRQLFERDRKAHKAAADYALSKGSASAEALLQDDGYVVYEGALSEGPLSDWLTHSASAGGRQNNAQKLVEAPVLVCTVDHLMPAVESTRGGHQIAPMLRLLTSDLVLDEVDDFGMEDLPALARLTYWAGLLGSRVLLSSATLPPALVQGLFAAYLVGRSAYQINRGNVSINGALGPSIVCAWFDEFGCVSSQHSDETSLRAAHDVFVQVRVQKLAKLPARRRAVIVPMDAGFTSQGKAWSTPQLFVTRVRAQALALHKINAQIDDITKASVSFGLIRMANISPLWQVAQMLLQAGAMAKEDTHIHLCVYHSRHPLLVRSRIESVLDTVLRRNPNDPQAIFRHDDVRLALQQSTAKNHIFIVLATAVAEVGRDHDYDWAVVEPSSMRSLIQLAGRVRRHRPQLFEANNIAVLDFNWQGLKNPGAVSFQRPGFEKSGHFALATHQLSALVDMQTLTTISAKPRILQPAVLSAKTSLADLEHARLSALLLVSGEKVEMNIRQFWDASAHLTGHEQQINRFRKRNSDDATFAFVPGDDDRLHFMREQEGQWTSADAQHLQPPVELRVGSHISMWPVIDLATEIETLATERGMSVEDCAKRFATVELAVIQGDKPVVWKYAPELGFTRAS